MSEFIEPRRSEERFQSAGIALDFGKVALSSIFEGAVHTYQIGITLISGLSGTKLDRN